MKMKESRAENEKKGRVENENGTRPPSSISTTTGITTNKYLYF